MLKKAQHQASFALATAVTAKAVYFKLPKTEAKKDRDKIISEAQKHITRANLDKDLLCCSSGGEDSYVLRRDALNV